MTSRGQGFAFEYQANGRDRHARAGLDAFRGRTRRPARRRPRRLPGQLPLGIRMDRLLGAVPLDLLEGYPLRQVGNPYTRDEYEKTTGAATEELVNAPDAVAERLETWT
jgi:hypothetical protein